MPEFFLYVDPTSGKASYLLWGMIRKKLSFLIPEMLSLIVSTKVEIRCASDEQIWPGLSQNQLYELMKIPGFAQKMGEELKAILEEMEITAEVDVSLSDGLLVTHTISFRLRGNDRPPKWPEE